MPISDEDLHTAMHAYLRRNNPEICRHWFDRIAVLGIERGVLRLLVDEPVRLKRVLDGTALAEELWIPGQFKAIAGPGQRLRPLAQPCRGPYGYGRFAENHRLVLDERD